MNQILMVKNDTNTKKALMSTPTKFFAIVALIFAVILLFEGSYNLYTSLSKDNSYPMPVMNSKKSGSDLQVSITNGIGISKILYSWNNGENIEFKGDGKRDITMEIAIPQGNNILKMSVIDIEGNKTKFEEIPVAFTESEDSIKPKISIENVDGKLKVTAVDETEISYLKYQWEGEEEVSTDVKDEENKKIVQEIEVQKGTKKLVITAEDKAGNEEVVTKKILGSSGPAIKVTLEDGNFVVKVTDEYKITNIKYTLNEEEFTVDGIPENATEYEFRVPLKTGTTNYLKINAYENSIMTEYKCKKTM